MKKITFALTIGVALMSCKSMQKSTRANLKNYNPVVAHRGAWKEAKNPQNSIASLKEAIKIGCVGSEFDVHLTKDDSLVICHDDDYQGLTIEKSTYAELAAKKLSNGETIPTLQEYLTAGMDQTATKLVLEVKKSIISKERTIQLTERCVDLVRQLHAQKWILYISFDYNAVKKIRSLDAHANIEYLEGDVAPAQLKADKINGLDYHISVYQKHPEWIAESKKLGLDLNAWTVNEQKDLQFFIDHQFKYITTNEPELLFQLLSK